MASMGASPVWLDFVDGQYLADDETAAPADIAPALQQAIEAADPTAVFLPMGLAHPDHIATHDAGLLVRAAMGEGASWFGYEDHGYKHLPGMLAWRVSRLFQGGLWPTPVGGARSRRTWPPSVRRSPATRARSARSQRDHLLDERLDANVPEQYWRLAPPPKGGRDWRASARPTRCRRDR